MSLPLVIDESFHAPAAAKEATLKEQWLADQQAKLTELYPKPGQFIELNGFLFRVRKIGTKGDVVLRRFTGSITVPKQHATATMIAGAKKA